MKEHKMQLSAWLNKIESLPYSADAHFNFQQSQELANRLNLKKYPSFTIAITGTNGKGSVAASLERVCLLNQLSCGVLTSPHIKRFNERIRLNGQDIKDEQLVKIFEKIEQYSSGLYLHYFHYAYFAGLLFFQQIAPQVVILEVGLGGGLDPINVIENDMTIITNVDYDHCDLLGDTLEKIGLEKAQLIRPHTPVIFGDYNCPQSIQKVIHDRCATLYQLGQVYDFDLQENTWEFNWNKIIISSLPKPNILLNNAATAMMAGLLFPNVESKKMKESFFSLWQNFSVPGRMQWLTQQNRTWLLDVAHNPQSASHLAAELDKVKNKFGKICALFTVGKKKDAANMIRPFLEIVDEWFIVALPDKRISNLEELQQIFRQFSATCYYYPNMKNAYHALNQHVSDGDLIVVWGSFLIVDAALNVIGG